MSKKCVLIDLGDTIIVEELYKTIWDEDIRKVEFIDELLTYLVTKRYRLAVVTNTIYTEAEIRTVLRRLNLEQYFDAVVTSTDVGFMKPETEIFIEALRRLGAKPEEAVMLGDRLDTDISGAKRLGITTIYFHWNERYKMPISENMKPDFTVKSLREVMKIL